MPPTPIMRGAQVSPANPAAALSVAPAVKAENLHPFAAAAAWPCEGEAGRPLWQMRFEGAALVLGAPNHYRVRILGVPGSAVRWVRLRQPDQVLFEMGSREVGLGHVSTAGEIIEAMAAMSGHHGMLIDCGRPQAAPVVEPTTLDLLLHLPHAGHARQVRVQAEVHGAG